MSFREELLQDRGLGRNKTGILYCFFFFFKLISVYHICILCVFRGNDYNTSPLKIFVNYTLKPSTELATLVLTFSGLHIQIMQIIC